MLEPTAHSVVHYVYTVTTSNTDKPVGTVAIYQCDRDYWLMTGDLYRRRSRNGTWTGTPATCAGTCARVSGAYCMCRSVFTCDDY